MKRLLGFVLLVACSSPREEVTTARAKLTRSVHAMNEIRGRFACTELPSGKILAIGSDTAGGSYSSTAEIYDPIANTWSVTGSLVAGRWEHSAVRLDDGRVLVVGGYEDDKTPPELSSAELFDPATGKFTSTGSMAEGRKLFGLVGDGKTATAVAGLGGGTLFTVERYDRTTGAWTALANVTNSHSPSQAVLTTDGKILVTGGADETELFDGSAWTLSGLQRVPREDATLTALPDGRVLAAGGTASSDSNIQSTAEVFDPKTRSWTATKPMAHPRSGHAAVRVASGLVIVAGGEASGDIEAFDPKTNAFSTVGYLATPREALCGTTLGSGAIFLGGALVGSYNTYLPSVDVWEPSSTITPSEGGFDASPTSSPIKPESFQRCAKNADCATGHCVEGLCCDSACTDACHSCALPSSPGICSPEPVGVDLKGECGGGVSCTGTCGPEHACVGSGPGAQCAGSRCTSASTGVGPALCTAAGSSCPTDRVAFDCGAYACEPAFGACLASCGSSADCAGGFVCDTNSKTCSSPSVGPDPGGCAYGKSANESSLVALLLLMLIAARFRPE